jgi:hypothetical protein
MIHYGLPDQGQKKPLLTSDGSDPDDPDGQMTNE